MQDKILKEVCKKFNITEEEGVQLEEQFWMEYVIHNLNKMECDVIYIAGMGRFESSIKYVKKTIKRLSGKPNIEEFQLKLENLKQMTDERNQKKPNASKK